MADFKKQGGSLTGREERYDGFEGEPRAVGGALGGHSSSTTGTGLGSSTSGTGVGGHHSSSTTAGPHNSNLENKMDPRVDSDMDGSRGMGRTHGTGSGTTGGYGSGPAGDGYDTTSTKKPGLMDKLNPMKDSDGDGRRGIGK